MAILVAEKALETETSCWYKFVCDTTSDIATLPTSQTTGTSYRVKKTARPTSIAYCVGEARLYMLDSNDKWRALYGLSDDVLDALGKSAKELLAICKETEGYRDSASESAAAAAASESAAAESETNAKASENAASGSQAAAAQSESNAKASENASKSSENASAKSEKNAKASEIAAAASQDAAKISETNAASSEGAAAASQSAAALSESNAKSSETKAKSSEDAALASQNAAKSSEQKSASSEAAAKASEEAAKASENAAAASETAAAQSESNAADSQAAALASENAAAASQAAASSSEGAAKSSENKAAESASASASSASASAASANNSENSATRSDSSAAAAKKSETNAAASESAAASSATAALVSEKNSSSSAASAAQSAEKAKIYAGTDPTLSTEGAPADAKAVGDKFKSIKTDWNSVTDKPETFPPSAHNHSKLAFERGNEVNFVGTPESNYVYFGYRDSTIKEYRFAKGQAIDNDYADLRANKFIGSLEGNADTASSATKATGVTDYNSSSRTIQVGYAGEGLNTSNLTHIAGYTDDGTKIKDVSKDVLKSWLGISNLYPVGSIYMSTSSTSPASLFGGTWESIASERVLMGVSSSHGAGSTVSAGLPNISGAVLDTWHGGSPSGSGALSISVGGRSGVRNGDDGAFTWGNFYFNAASYNSIYGNSSTVQPATYYVYMWRRTA